MEMFHNRVMLSRCPVKIMLLFNSISTLVLSKCAMHPESHNVPIDNRNMCDNPRRTCAFLAAHSNSGILSRHCLCDCKNVPLGRPTCLGGPLAGKVMCGALVVRYDLEAPVSAMAIVLLLHVDVVVVWAKPVMLVSACNEFILCCTNGGFPTCQVVGIQYLLC